MDMNSKATYGGRPLEDNMKPGNCVLDGGDGALREKWCWRNEVGKGRKM